MINLVLDDEKAAQVHNVDPQWLCLQNGAAAGIRNVRRGSLIRIR